MGPLLAVLVIVSTGQVVRQPIAIIACPLTSAGCNTRAITTVRNTTAWLEQADGDGDSVAANLARFHTTFGVLSFPARTNGVANSLDASAWSNTNTPIVTINTTAGPFSSYAGGNEADTIEDDSSNYEGKWARIGTTTGTYINSIYIKAGTATTAYAGLVSDADGNAQCTFAGLNNMATATCTGGGGTCAILCRGHIPCSTAGAQTFTGGFGRLYCQATVSGAVTTMDARIWVGNTSATTGTIIVSGWTAGKYSYAGPPIMCGGAACTVNADVHTQPSAGMPTTAGSVYVEYTPINATNNNQVLFDTLSSNNGIQLARDATNGLTLTLGNGSATGTTAASPALTWTVGTTYRLEARWGNGNAFLLRDGAVVGSTTSGTAKIPTAHNASMYLGCDASSANQADGYLRNLRVRRW